MPPYFIPKNLKIPAMPNLAWYDAVSLVGFIDAGRASNYKHQYAGSQTYKTLLGTGFGVMAYLKPDLYLNMYVGFPFGDDSIDKNNAQVHLAIRAGF